MGRGKSHPPGTLTGFSPRQNPVAHESGEPVLLGNRTLVRTLEGIYFPVADRGADPQGLKGRPGGNTRNMSEPRNQKENLSPF